MSRGSYISTSNLSSFSSDESAMRPIAISWIPNIVRDWMTPMAGGNINTVPMRFVIIGLAGAFGYFVLNFFFQTRFRLSPFLASALAYGLAFSLVYLGQKIWAFRSTSPHTKSLPRYAIVQLVSLFTGSAITQLAATYGGLSPILSSACAAAVAGVVSYTLSRTWAFSDA